MEKKHYGFGVILLLIEIVLIVLMAITAGYDKDAKPSVNIKHGDHRDEEEIEVNLIDTKHPGNRVMSSSKSYGLISMLTHLYLDLPIDCFPFS